MPNMMAKMSATLRRIPFSLTCDREAEIFVLEPRSKPGVKPVILGLFNKNELPARPLSVNPLKLYRFWGAWAKTAGARVLAPLLK
jgi:hypothetical protein